jgi:glucuronoarabinoxylan endo-1,4-beta-xylanase
MKRLSVVSLAILSCVVLALAGCTGLGKTTAPVNPLSPTVTTLSVSPNPASVGATITLTAIVSSSTGNAEDNVSFFDGATLLGTSQLGASSNTATLTVSNFAANSTHTLSAMFLGDAINAKSTSNSVPIAIGSVTAPSTINVHAGFTFSSPNQTISGFGAAEAFDLTYLDTHPYASEMYKALFDPTAGLGLTYLRVQNLYRGTAADPDTPQIVAAANAAHGTPLSVLMSSWSPPANLKSNGSVNGCTVVTNGACTGGIGTLVQVSGAYDYADFATYWSNSLTAYAAAGVVPSYISIQNEPDFTPTYAGMRLNPTEATYNGTNYAGYGLAFDAVYKKIQGLATVPKMVGPETASVGQTFIDIAAQIPTSEIAVYAHHLYNVSSGSATVTGTTTTITPGGSPDSGIPALSKLASTYPTALKFTTEYYDTPGFYNAWTIHNALAIGNDNGYIFWQAVWPSVLTTAKDQAADQAGLLYADNPGSQATWVFSHGWTYNDAYYALKQYSYFVKPGYIRYTATVDNPDERASVYQSPDGKTTVIVLLNTSTSVTDGVSLDLSSVPYTTSAVYRSNFSVAIGTGERFTSIGSYQPPTSNGNGNNSGGIALPPQGVVTIVLTK